MPCSKVVGYYGSWAIYRPGAGKFEVEDIDPNLYTHLIYSFLGIGEDGRLQIRDEEEVIRNNVLEQFSNLKNENHRLKVLVAIGGWNEKGKVFSKVSKSQSKRRALIKSVVQFLRKYDFDGLDFDWEYPGDEGRGGDGEDKDNFALWMQEFREEFDRHGYLLTAAVAASQSKIDTSYNVPDLNEALDFINLMTYDMSGAWDGRTGHNAPISGVKSSVKAWIRAGMNPRKIVMGVPAYGHSFTLSNSRNHGPGASTSGPGDKGQYTREDGMLGYNEIAENIKSDQWTLRHDDDEQVPYMYKGNQWVSYDDKDSIATKVRLAKSKGLGGIMVWSIDTDDFKGRSGRENRIAKTIRNNL